MVVEIENVRIDFIYSTKGNIRIDIDDLARDYMLYNYDDYRDALNLFVDEVIFEELGINPDRIIKAQNKKNPHCFEVLNFPGMSIDFNLICSDETVQ